MKNKGSGNIFIVVTVIVYLKTTENCICSGPGKEFTIRVRIRLTIIIKKFFIFKMNTWTQELKLNIELVSSLAPSSWPISWLSKWNIVIDMCTNFKRIDSIEVDQNSIIKFFQDIRAFKNNIIYHHLKMDSETSPNKQTNVIQFSNFTMNSITQKYIQNYQLVH